MHTIYVCYVYWLEKAEVKATFLNSEGQMNSSAATYKMMTGIIYIFWLLVWCWLVATPAVLCHAIVSSGMRLECSNTRDGLKSSRSSSSAELPKFSHQHFQQMLSTSPRRVAVSYWVLNQQKVTALFPSWLSSIDTVVAVRLYEILILFLIFLCSPAVLIHKNSRPS